MSFFARFRRPPNPEPTTPQEEVAGPVPSRRRRIAAQVTTVLAGLLVFVVLVVPDQVSRLAPGSFLLNAFVRIPIEGLIGAAVLLVLPERPRRVVATVAGGGLGLLTVLKIIDMGFFAVLARSFDPVLDWGLFADGFRFLTGSMGRARAIGAVIGAVLFTLTLIVLTTLAVRRLARVVLRHRRVSIGAITALAAAWAACSLLGVQLVAGVPVASDTAATLAYTSILQVPRDLQDRKNFAKEVAVDAFRGTPGTHLLTGLRGKDVVFAFIESYGRDAVEDPEFAPQVDALLDAGTARLTAAGYSARSGFLTSPTAGGGSWLAHSTLQSGVWVDNEQRYRSLVSSDRLTLTSAFKRTNVRTVGVEPGVTYAWPEGKFYGYDQVYDAQTLGYAGPKFGWATMPDQYTLSAFERLEHGKKNRGPLMAEITFVSSHTPWAPLPRIVGWDEVGDGAIYGPMAKDGYTADEVWKDPARVRAEYRRSIEYSLNSLISYVETYGDQNLVLVFLGDHQPAPIVTGQDASRDVPITIVAHDRGVLDRIAGWGWQDGLRPGPQAPVWRMDAFRDRFLTAFGPEAGHAG